MKYETYKKLSPLGKRRARVMWVVDAFILTAIALAALLAAANAMELLFISLGI